MALIAQMPKLTDTMEEGVIVRWMIKPGDAVKPGQQVAEVETDKAVMPLEAFDPGVVLKLLAVEGKPVPLGEGIYLLGAEGEAPPPEGAMPAPAPAAAPAAAPVAPVAALAAPPAVELPPGAATKRIRVSPLAAKMASEQGLDLLTLTGSGPAGRIVRRDVEEALKKRQEKQAPTQRGSEITPLSMLRKTVAKRLTQAKQQVPHFYLEREVDATALKQLQQTLKAELPDAHISLNDVLIKCCAHALRRVPACNASFTEEGIATHSAIHVSVAVAIEEGLITPVIRNADQKSVLQIATEMHALAEKAKARRLMPEEYTGGTFSLSNLGMFGIDKFAAIINPPEAMILAVGKVIPKPVVENGQVVVRDRLWLTLSCDHRVVDGALAATFIAELAQAIEHPLRMLVV